MNEQRCYPKTLLANNYEKSINFSGCKEFGHELQIYKDDVGKRK
ncbi:MAG: hypothetical protein OCC45_13225 [Desulfotalea sp.]